MSLLLDPVYLPGQSRKKKPIWMTSQTVQEEGEVATVMATTQRMQSLSLTAIWVRPGKAASNGLVCSQRLQRIERLFQVGNQVCGIL